jgi:hypothetical protein
MFGRCAVDILPLPPIDVGCLTIVQEQLQFPKVALVEPSPSGYIQNAAEVENWAKR